MLDEIQRCPALLSWLQGLVDERRRMGDFVLTGSRQFELAHGLTQTLAGRVGRLELLLPLSAGELRQAGRLPASLEELLWCGGYPPLYDRPVEPTDWLPAYVATYVERDVRQWLEVRDLTLFQRFVRMCAARTGQPLNLTALAADCGVSATTARQWLSVLEASYLVLRLPPYHQNIGKRLVKTPKLYFLDAGLAAWLAGIRAPAQLHTHALRGALFETWVVSEVVKAFAHCGRSTPLFFWHDSTGLEVDLVWETADGLQGAEITWRPDRSWTDLARYPGRPQFSDATAANRTSNWRTTAARISSNSKASSASLPSTTVSEKLSSRSCNSSVGGISSRPLGVRRANRKRRRNASSRTWPAAVVPTTTRSRWSCSTCNTTSAAGAGPGPGADGTKVSSTPTPAAWSWARRLSSTSESAAACSRSVRNAKRRPVPRSWKPQPARAVAAKAPTASPRIQARRVATLRPPR